MNPVFNLVSLEHPFLQMVNRPSTMSGKTSVRLFATMSQLRI